MRFFVNTMTFMIFAALFAGTVGVGLFVVMLHYQGLAASFELLRFDTRALADDPLVGTIFMVMGAGANFAHYSAAAIALTNFLLCSAAVFLVNRLVALFIGAPGYFNNGQAQDWWRTMWTNVASLIMVCVPLYYVLMWDAAMFVTRFRVGTLDAASEIAAVRAILSGPPDDSVISTFGQAFIRGDAFAGYIAMAIASPILIEFALRRMAETLVVMFETPDDGEFGDADTDDGFDTGTPANDTSDEEADARTDRPDEPVRPARSAQADNEGEEAARYAVLGRPGETVTLAEALARKERFVVTRESGTPKIWDRAYWTTLNGDPENDEEAA